MILYIIIINNSQFLNTLKIYKETCDLILTEIDNTTSLLDKLDTNYQFVENKTKTLKQACESLVAEQVNIKYI